MLNQIMGNVYTLIVNRELDTNEQKIFVYYTDQKEK